MSLDHRQPLDLDLVFVRACLGKVVGGLHAQQGIGLDAEGLLEPDGHLREQAGMAVEHVAKRLSRHAEVCGEHVHVDAGRLDELVLKEFAGVEREGRMDLNCEGGRLYRLGGGMSPVPSPNRSGSHLPAFSP